MIDAIKSVLAQNFDDVEIIVVDDCSTDQSFELFQEFVKTIPQKISLFKTERNTGGPGIPQNIALMHARGKYILILDQDDTIADGFFEKLFPLTESNPDLVCYDRPRKVIPQDSELLKDYLRLHMDGSPLYTLFNREFLKRNKIRFRAGFHEDVDFMFQVYFHAKTIETTDFAAYKKLDRAGSIVNTISEQHIEGYFEAFRNMRVLIENRPDLLNAWEQGIDNLCAFKIRDIVRLNSKDNLYEYLYDVWSELRNPNVQRLNYLTRFQMIVDEFDRIMKDPSIEKKSVEIEKMFKDLWKKKWSCYDLQNSMLCTPEEIRACCRQFFRDGKMCGDVSLVKIDPNEKFDPAKLVDDVFKAKKKLEFDINRGVDTVCYGCPHLSFDEWNSQREVGYISMEYHTLCNLRCQYCSEEFYGGRTPTYDIKAFVEECLKQNLLENVRNIVYAGGEPTIVQGFEEILNLFAEAKKDLCQFVITNGTIFSPKISDLLAHNRVAIMTSIDSGNRETYKKIRGRDLLMTVLNNLKKYAQSNATNMIVKYIVLNENSSIDELKAYAQKIQEFDLLECGLQIGTNWKYETVDENIVHAAVALYGLLLESGARVVYFDEMLQQRIGNFDQTRINELHAWLEENQLPDPIEIPSDQNVCIYGSYEMIKYLMQNTYYFSKKKPYKIFASHAEDVGKIISGIQIETPNFDSESKIIIAAVQGTYKLIKELPNPELRIKKLIL